MRVFSAPYTENRPGGITTLQHMHTPATGKVRRPTVESLDGRNKLLMQQKR